MRRSRSRLLALPLGLALVAGLAACGEDETEATPTPGADEATASPEPEPVDDAAACLEGEWDLDVTDQLAAQQALMGVTDAEVQVDGSATLTFTDGTVVRTLDEVESQVSFTFMDEQMEVWSRQDGTATGSYTVTGDRLDIVDTDQQGLTLEQRTLINGEEFEIPDVDLGDLSTDEAYTFTCSDSELRLVPDFSALTGEGMEMLAELDPEEYATVLTRR
ncbi:hypothetical protein [Cellulomonas bogoriensis]|uniref:Uncharacterized protein n=1 Tax=Cellulomonas bogoriensis 69B4 = DSM 16987 TaxID=1386082 RepID=A0A0A0BW50_9CELL|nr:hypothetical protein [Cellulomonas bogoriensis]KGM11912.1 hypothetical protein N869_02335 [Cellulomonas bogoriensis 69B4 = DSM 16987]